MIAHESAQKRLNGQLKVGFGLLLTCISFVNSCLVLFNVDRGRLGVTFILFENLPVRAGFRVEPGHHTIP